MASSLGPGGSAERMQVASEAEQCAQEPTEQRSHCASFSMCPPGAEELTRLHELLTEALKREAEAYKKVKHLHELLMEARSSPRTVMSDGSQPTTPEVLWDSELSQTSDGSPQSPLAVIVVSGSPALPRKRKSAQQHTPDNLHILTNGNSASTFPQDSPSSKFAPPDQASIETQTRLAPSPQDYRGVRQEREKPPTALPLPVPPPPQRTSLLEQEEAHSPPLLSQGPTSTAVLPTSVVRNQEEESLVQSVDVGHPTATELQPPPTRPAVARSNSTKGKRNKKGYRSRSNTTTLLPGWMRRKKQAGKDATSLHHSLDDDSIEEMFHRFVRVASIITLQDGFAAFIDRHWSELYKESSSCSIDVRKYRDAVWDLFQAEAKFLTRSLQPLEQVYKGFLEELHFHGILKVADVDKIFANLSELCELSCSMARDFFTLFEGRSENRIAPNNELILSFSMFGHKFNPVYQRFCVNYEKQCGFVRALEQLPDFKEYMRVCRNHEAVGKNDLSALLIAPMKHQCHYQLLLEKVLKYTKSKEEKDLLSSAIKAFVVSLKELEANIAENKRSAEMLELQETLCWPSLSQLETTAYIPDALDSQLSCQPCSYVLASKDRQLLHKGPLKLLEGTRHSKDVFAFLFTDSLLLTQQYMPQTDKKASRKEELTRYRVWGHPLLLSMLDIHGVAWSHAHGHLISLVERNTFQQQMAIYSLQATSKEEKEKWLSQLTNTRNMICYRNSPRCVESAV